MRYVPATLNLNGLEIPVYLPAGETDAAIHLSPQDALAPLGKLLRILPRVRQGQSVYVRFVEASDGSIRVRVRRR